MMEKETLLNKYCDFKICPDVVFLIDDGGILASNHRARRHVWLSLQLFNALAGVKVENNDLKAMDKTVFSNTDGLLADPTCLNRDSEAETVNFSKIEDALDYLFKRFILIKEEDEYESYFKKKNSIIDRHHFGTFHQQLGSELRIKLRVDPAKWWYEQKFDPATGNTRNNLYKFIQEAFLNQYFSTLQLEGKTVLDFGCGSGMASQYFVNKGAKVIGIDPDEKLLKKALDKIGDKFLPVLLKIDNPNPLESLPSEPVDFIWMADVFMFYFYPQDAKEITIKPEQLLLKLARNLRKNGKCVIMQPHGAFWLSPWLGSKNMPYTILTEYSKKLYSVVPGLQELSDTISTSGLAISRIFEPVPEESEEGKNSDSRAWFFANTFPQWWVFECIKL